MKKEDSLRHIVILTSSMSSAVRILSSTSSAALWSQRTLHVFYEAVISMNAGTILQSAREEEEHPPVSNVNQTGAKILRQLYHNYTSITRVAALGISNMEVFV